MQLTDDVVQGLKAPQTITRPFSSREVKSGQVTMDAVNSLYLSASPSPVAGHLQYDGAAG
ncbi:hypothetical protein E2C01_013977 [Portunus trituberculatus]|uniref:Uncharacterized protein n=1 Tax=Portunus trituberculatus TaxID=210409 RepID=A0A5B7DIM5_PORTR|nr:hypothetical protein [Portunus trituberculatus]